MQMSPSPFSLQTTMTASRRSLCALVLLGLSLASSITNAQVATDSISPRAGGWGVEASYGSGSSASLLYFSSPRAAWLIGGHFTIGRETQDQNQPFGGVVRTTDPRAN